jgi:chitinase
MSTSVGSAVSQSSYSTSVPGYGQGYNTYGASSAPVYDASSVPGAAYNAYGASSVPVYGTSSMPVYGGSSVSSAASNGYSNYGDSSKATATPTPYEAWSSQAGCVPVTQTYTKTDIKTITKCNGDYKNCPVNSATPTVIVTNTKTGTIVVAVPTTTVYVTSIVDVCPTGLTTKIATITQTCNSGCTSKPTGVPQGYTTIVKYCDACATPSTVTVTYCTACAATPIPAKPTPPPAPKGPASTPAQVSAPAKMSSAPSYNSQAKSTTSAPPAVPYNPKPVVGVSYMLSKPSAPVGGNATMPVVSTPAKTINVLEPIVVVLLLHTFHRRSSRVPRPVRWLFFP